MKQYITQIAEHTKDYQETGIGCDRVEAWINQFDASLRQPIAEHTVQWIEKFYFSRSRTTRCIIQWCHFAKDLCDRKKISFPYDVHFFDVQHEDSSQKNMLEILSDYLELEYDTNVEHCDGEKLEIYIDDFVLSGGNMFRHARKLQSKNLLLFHLATTTNFNHTRTLNEIKRHARYASKKHQEIDMHVDCFMPSISLSAQAQEYKRKMDNHFQYYPVKIRSSHVKNDTFFKDQNTRKLIEDHFLEIGLDLVNAYNKAITLPPDSLPLNEHGAVSPARPLGFSPLSNFGFGCFVASYRNIPNNCPLVFWSGANNWISLFEPIRYGGRYD